MVLVAIALLTTGLPGVGAQDNGPPTDAVASQGTCEGLNLTVIEPTTVAWESDSSPILNPSALWAYGDPGLLHDDEFDQYWYHWYNAVPGPDPYVVFEFAPGTTVDGIEFVTDWSDGDLLIEGLDGSGNSVSPVSAIELDDPFTPYAASFDAMTVTKVKMTTSTQQVKLLEVDFCTSGETETDLNLNVTTPACESLAATWETQPGTTSELVVLNSADNQVGFQNSLSNNYGPVDIGAGTYSVTVTASSAAETATDTSTVTVQECTVTGCVDLADAYCESTNVIDSFGDQIVPDTSGAHHAWNTVTQYYEAYGDRDGMCDIDIHNSYWTGVRGPGGDVVYYPSWHPPVHDQGGLQECKFFHEHGMDPRTSDLYDEAHPTNVGVPFGFVHPAHGGQSDRFEDHVGHKVVVWNDFYLTTSNPYHGDGFPLSLYEPDGAPVECDWYTKLHQGTHSPDALGHNMHEYFFNYSCDDGTEVRIKEMTDFGFRLPAANTSPDFPLTGGTGTVGGCGWFSTNLPGPASDPDPSDDSDFGDAGRGFTCLMNDAKIEELWKPSAYLSAPAGGGTVAYDPYYVVMNPNRFALYEWWDLLEQDGDHVGENAMISMVDFCVEGSELREELSRSEAPGNFVKDGEDFDGPFRVMTFCDSIDAGVLANWAQDIVNAGGDNEALMLERKESADNPFVGTRRGVHTKGPVVYGREANFGSFVFFCSDHFGNASQWPTNPNTGDQVTPNDPWLETDPVPICGSGVPQIMSDFFNNHFAVEGSTAGATESGGSFISNGPASEITIDIDELFPGHGVRAPN